MKQPELGKKIAEIRKANGLTQDELARNCNLSLRTIQRIESGLVNPRSYTVKILGINLGYAFYNSFEEKNFSVVLKSIINNVFRHITKFLNLRTNTIKKLSILLGSICIIIMLFALSTKNNAQKIDESKFTKSNGRGIIYFFPKGHAFNISNVKDTADYKIGKNLIQEYKNKIFLNGEYQGRAFMGDTVILNKNKIFIKSSYWNFTSSTGKGIVYLIPKGISIDNLAVQIDTENLYIGKHHIQEYEYKIFLNQVYQGKANKGDTVIFKDGIITIIE